MLNMKSLTVLFTLAFSHSLFSQSDSFMLNKNLCQTRLFIESQTVELIDGVPASSVFDMVLLINLLRELREGTTDRSLIMHDNKTYSVRQLIEFERDQNFDKKLLKELLEVSLVKFENIYLKIYEGKNIILWPTIAGQWAVLANRSDAFAKYLNATGKHARHAVLQESIKSFVAFDQLTQDVICFLKDFGSSCKQSMQIFKDIMAKQASHK